MHFRVPLLNRINSVKSEEYEWLLEEEEIVMKFQDIDENHGFFGGLGKMIVLHDLLSKSAGISFGIFESLPQKLLSRIREVDPDFQQNIPNLQTHPM